jgi:SAM-dependent methyltransferase
MPLNEAQTKSKQRVTDHGEVFTADREVNAMLDLVKQETERIDSRFLEPACGNGNFLAEILRRKLVVVKSRYKKSQDDYERYAVLAISSIYGIDILQDNVDECRNRLFDIFNSEYSVNCKKIANDETRQAARHIFKHNIVCGDALTLKTSTGKPIIFAEWSAVNSYLLKRRDFSYEELSEQKDENSLFPSNKSIINDMGQTVFVPQTVAEFRPVHYRKVKEYE